MNRSKRAGFTLIEMVVVLVIVGILSLIAVPSIIGFIESGNQINRTNIAETLYRAAQNRLTEMKITKNLKAEFPDYYTKNPDGSGYAENIFALENHNNVYSNLGGYIPADEPEENRDYVHFIQKPKNEPEALPDNPVVRLLDPVILDKSVLDGAILIELNVKTGVILSVFYSDKIDGEFSYTDTGSESVAGKRGMGENGYEFAAKRKQGYFGTAGTGEYDTHPPALVNINDSYTKKLPDDAAESCDSVLYAEMFIPKKLLSGVYDLTINDIIVESGVDLEAQTTGLSSLNDALFYADTAATSTNTALLYRYDNGIDNEYARIIWILDYVGGDMTGGTGSNLKHSIGEKYASKISLDAKTNIHAGMQGNIIMTSFTEANPYFHTEAQVEYDRNAFSVMTQRHLNNIRYQGDVIDGDFTQKEDIIFSGDHSVTNFAPIPDFHGTFTGHYQGVSYRIQNLTINLPATDNVGLFSAITGMKHSGIFNKASVVGVNLRDPKITGKNNVGAVCGILDGSISGVNIQYTKSSGAIQGQRNIGGITGENRGIISDSVFVSPTSVVHITASAKDTAGGITGNNNTGELRRILYLALAPENAGTINPIAGMYTADIFKFNKLYYLYGSSVRPSGLSDDNYNGKATNGLGDGLGTNELYYEVMSETDSWTKNILNEDDTLKTSNTIYPYSYVTYLFAQNPKTPNWPIVTGVGSIRISNIAYYEKYEDNTYGIWFSRNGTSDGALENNKIITETGYTVITDRNITGSHYLFAKNSTTYDPDSWKASDRIVQIKLQTGTDFSKGIAKAAGKSDVWTFTIPTESLASLADRSTPLQIMHTMNSNGSNPKQINGFLHPLFAKGLYEDFAALPEPAEFSVRTPWQMRNISVLITSGTASGKIFSQEKDLNFSHTGLGVNAAKGSVSYSDLTTSAVTGNFNGTYNGNSHKISALTIKASSSDNIGLFSENAGTLTGIRLSDSSITGRNQVGGITGKNNKDAVTDACISEKTVVTGTENTGTVIGLNAGDILRSAAEYSSVSAKSNIGGITGNNSGTVTDVYFLSTADFDNLPVPNAGGGIVGNNSGTVTNVFFLAPSPSSVTGGKTTIYPIVRSGTPGIETGDSSTCFYLAGSRYSLDEGKVWTDTFYNRSGITSAVECSGGGTGIISKFIDLEWLNFSYNAKLSDWKQPSSGYPYPVLKSIGKPSKWSLTDSPVRPDQNDRSDWVEASPTSNRAVELGFVNSDFSESYDLNNGRVVESVSNRRDYVEMGAVNGWNTRPVNASDAGKAESYWMELQVPAGESSHSMYNDYAYTNHEGKYDSPQNISTSKCRYAELNAAVQGTLYQLCPTTPGAQFHYSFFHTSRLSGSTGTISDKMSFYLTGVSNTANYANDSDLVLIRPCVSPRSRATTSGSKITNYNPAVKNTVAYGNNYNGHDLSYYKPIFSDFPSNNKPYLYDVWIDDLGYGITFWSTSNVSVSSISTGPVSSISKLPSSLRSDAQTHVIGYWGESYGWKQYYGLYTVPASQVRTEFAYQSNTANATNGNFLSGISFKAPSFLSIDKSIKMDNTDVKFVKPGDELTVELNIKSWGEISPSDIVIKDQISPYNPYVEVVSNSIQVEKNDSSGSLISKISNSTITMPSKNNDNVLSVGLPAATSVSHDEVITIRFKLKVLLEVKDNSGVSTLLYYFKNQATVEYSSAELDAYTRMKKTNASGPEPVQIFIDPIKLSNTVKTVDYSSSNDPLLNGPFQVSLKIENTLDGSANDGIITTGLINVLIPKDFKVSSKNNNLPADTVFTENSDGTTRMTIRNANLNKQIKSIEYKYILEYTGNGYGVSYTNVTADYKYLYSDGYNEMSVMLVFPQPVVGVVIRTSDDSFTISGLTDTLLNITQNDGFSERLSDANYDVTPEIILTDSTGKKITSTIDGNYTSNTTGYTATLIRGSNALRFVPKSYGEHTVYYQIKLTATKPGGIPSSFELSSPVKKVTVTVAAP